MGSLTDRKLETIKSNPKKDQWFSDGGQRGSGSLMFRVTKAGLKRWYFRYSNSSGKQEALPIADYDRKGKAGLTLVQARDEAAKHSRLYQSGIKDLMAHYEEETARAKAEKEAAEGARRRAEDLAKRGSLHALLAIYMENQERQGRISAQATRTRLKRHVLDPFPELAERQAASLTAADFREVLARVVEMGKGREAGILRSNLKAAYQLALTTEHDPTAPAGLSVFMIEYNPLDRIPALTQFNKTCERVLSWPELKSYFKRVAAVENPITRDALMVALFTGGQRLTQLMRVQHKDIDLDAFTMTLKDIKGRRQHARVHLLPVTDRVRDIVVQRINESIAGGYLFSNNGTSPVRIETLSKKVKEIAGEMLELGDSKEPFSLRDIRRTCETRLAQLGISKDLRAQIQSHGLGGVQDRHYDRHDYLSEKCRALLAWEERLLSVDEGNVVELKRA